jgi:hypothetical protein
MGEVCSWGHGDHDAHPGEAGEGMVASLSSSDARVLRRMVVVHDDGYRACASKRRCP